MSRRGRGGAAAAAGTLACLAAFLVAAAGRAEKKTPGLFDFGGWKSPVARQRDQLRAAAEAQFRTDNEPERTVLRRHVSPHRPGHRLDQPRRHAVALDVEEAVLQAGGTHRLAGG